MLRFFTIIFLFFSLLSSYQDKPLFEEYKTTLDTVHKNMATIADSPKIEIGASGIVVHRFGEQSSTILAKATVLAKDGIKALLELTPYDALEQNTFPKAELIPTSGDEVKLNYLYNRALIITPNYDYYKTVVNYFNIFDWIHPDIVAAHLAKESIPNPDRKKFLEICNKNLAGLVFFGVDEKGYFVDCASFTILKTVSLPEQDEESEIILPFYSRISSNIRDSWFVLNGAKVNNYELHYKALLGIE